MLVFHRAPSSSEPNERRAVLWCVEMAAFHSILFTCALYMYIIRKHFHSKPAARRLVHLPVHVNFFFLCVFRCRFTWPLVRLFIFRLKKSKHIANVVYLHFPLQLYTWMRINENIILLSSWWLIELRFVYLPRATQELQSDMECHLCVCESKTHDISASREIYKFDGRNATINAPRAKQPSWKSKSDIAGDCSWSTYSRHTHKKCIKILFIQWCDTPPTVNTSSIAKKRRKIRWTKKEK